jgi:hypothetical protein
MKRFLLLSTLSVPAFVSGCIGPAVKLNNADRLIARPDFKQAAQAAPEFVRDALKTINQLEYQLERK